MNPSLKASLLTLEQKRMSAQERLTQSEPTVYRPPSYVVFLGCGGFSPKCLFFIH